MKVYQWEQFVLFQEDRLHQLRKAEGSLAQDSTDCFRSWIVFWKIGVSKGVNHRGKLNQILDEINYYSSSSWKLVYADYSFTHSYSTPFIVQV